MIDLKEMLKAGVHFGHKTSRWAPKMRPFIWGAKNKIHLIDVSKTAVLLERSGKYLKEQASNGKSFLWVGTKKPAQDIIKKVAQDLNMPFVIHRWIGGTVTNFDQVKKAITRLLHLRDVVAKGSAKYKKKEISMIQKEIARLEKNIGGVVNLTYPPAAIILVDAQKEHSAIREASKLGIPLIAMVDTNTDPDGINFLIPANDDSPRSIDFIMKYLASCVKEGKDLYKEKRAKEPVQDKSRAPRRAEAPAHAPAPARVEHKIEPKVENIIEKKETAEKAPVKTTRPTTVVKKKEVKKDDK